MTTREPAAVLRGASVFLRLAAAVAVAILLSPVTTTLAAPGPVAFESASRTPSVSSDTIQLAAGKNFKASTRPPERGSSAELYGGSSADRYGGSSADERGVAGKHDPRNKGVRQFTVQNKKRAKDDHAEKKQREDEEMDDQDANPPREMFRFGLPDPQETQARDRRDKD